MAIVSIPDGLPNIQGTPRSGFCFYSDIFEILTRTHLFPRDFLGLTWWVSMGSTQPTRLPTLSKSVTYFKAHFLDSSPKVCVSSRNVMS